MPRRTLGGALGRLMAVVERYPDIKSGQNFVALQSELSGTENRIAIARRDYIQSVRAWTTIAGRHYWDGGLVSNSPLDQVVEVGGLTGKNVFVVNLWADKRALPRTLPEVLARRDEIVFAEKISRSIWTWEYIDNYRKLVDEVMASLETRR